LVRDAIETGQMDGPMTGRSTDATLAIMAYHRWYVGLMVYVVDPGAPSTNGRVWAE